MPISPAIPTTLLALVLTVPSVAWSQDVVKVWHAYRGQEQAALERTILQLQDRDPTVKVEVLAVPNEAFRNKLTSAIPRDNGHSI